MHNGRVAEESRQQGGGHWVVLSWNHQTLRAGLHPCSVPGIFVSWWEQPRLPRGEKQELTSRGLFQQPFCFFWVNCCPEESGHAVFARGPGQCRLAQLLWELHSTELFLLPLLFWRLFWRAPNFTPVWSCSSVIAKWKILFQNFLTRFWGSL